MIATDPEEFDGSDKNPHPPLTPESITEILKQMLVEYGPKIKRSLRKRGISFHDAEDAMSEACVRFLERCKKGVAIPNPGPWCIVTSNRFSIDYAIHVTRVRTCESESVRRKPAPIEDPADLVEAQELLQTLLEGMKLLPKFDLEIVLLHYYEGKPVTHIARDLCIANHKARARYTAAINALRKRFSV